MNDSLQIQELAITIAAKNHNPAVLTADFLKHSGIVPEDWELAQQPVTSSRASQVIFQNGVNIIAQPNQIVFSEPIATKDVQEVKAQQVASKYLQTLPNGDYQAVGINFRDYVTFPGLQLEDEANNYILGGGENFQTLRACKLINS